MKMILRLSRFLILYGSVMFCAESSPSFDEGERITALLNASQAVMIKNNILPIDSTVKAPFKKRIRKKKKPKKKHESKALGSLNRETALLNASQTIVSNNKAPSAVPPEPLVAVPLVERRPEKHVDTKREDEKTAELNKDNDDYSFASRVSKSAYNFSGFYVGVSSGYNQVYNKTTETFANFTDTAALYLNGKIRQNSLSGRGILGGAHFGIGTQFNRFYLGVQFEGNVQNTINKQVSGNSQTQYDMAVRNLSISVKNNLTLSLKTGVALDKALIYAKVGAALSKFQIKSEYPYFSALLGVGGAQYFNKRQIGLVIGTGVDVPVSKHVILSGEVSYTQYQKFSINHPGASKTDITPSALSFQLKASYKF